MINVLESLVWGAIGLGVGYVMAHVLVMVWDRTRR